MKPVQYTVRLPVSLDKALRALAERHGVSVYAMLQRSVKAGVAALANPPARDTGDREMVAELVSVGTRIVEVERMLDRTLFTACAAYCYARSAANGVRLTDEAIAIDINNSYDRQRQVSQGKRS
ncbi:MAG: hypothetical protein ACT6Q5_00470 [Sphingopyxis solisilvae]|uniref:hypothetical protein n=1 Tax=Sphingopyxis solisilvae TaxID=1886788 RepID=UPI0040370F6F